MIAWQTILLAFLVGAADSLVFHLYRPRLRNAFLAFPELKVIFCAWAIFAGIVGSVLHLALIAGGPMILGAAAISERGAWIAAFCIPLILSHVAFAWPGRNRFGQADQRTRCFYGYAKIWDAAGRHIEDRYSRSLERVAAEYASVPWDEGSLARIHARIVPHYRVKSNTRRVNPQLLIALKNFREKEDVYAFFYSILEEFGPRSVSSLITRL